LPPPAGRRIEKLRIAAPGEYFRRAAAARADDVEAGDERCLDHRVGKVLECGRYHHQRVGDMRCEIALRLLAVEIADVTD